MSASPRSYQLQIELSQTAQIEVGRLGPVTLPAGRYVYTGSARRGLEARIRRHLSAHKTLHWHIDYLLTHPAARVVSVQRSHTAECLLNQGVGGLVLVPGFGASDCRAGCRSHLRYLGGL